MCVNTHNYSKEIYRIFNQSAERSRKASAVYLSIGVTLGSLSATPERQNQVPTQQLLFDALLQLALTTS